MLRLQEYERVLKRILANHEFAGPVESLETQLAAQDEKFAGKTLGNLVSSLFERLAVPEGYKRDLLPEDDLQLDRPCFAFSYRIAMEPSKLAETRAALVELVGLRNELVHHFIERFDLYSDEGCTAAVEHLRGCYERIDFHHRQLMAWVHGLEQAGAQMASFAQSEAFRDVLVNGIALDGSFEWACAGIVRALKGAAAELAEDGWTRLDVARAWIEAVHSEQTPAKYGCRTWPQVLSESRMFDLEYRAGEDGRKVAWFRQRSAARL